MPVYDARCAEAQESVPYVGLELITYLVQVYCAVARTPSVVLI